ncbi:universal stress protein [Rhodoferax sp. WC2427]|uniref:universal stress protein n=1 Tax=Rhodoferax sp. WC2427 TaxID=3234144 RepID=UPI0034663B3F
MLKHILLATDGSAASDHAAAMAVDLARSLGARLTALYAVDPYPYLGMGMGEVSSLGLSYYKQAAQEEAESAHAKVAALCQQGTPVVFNPVVLEERDVVSGIVGYGQAEKADLIVVGSHGRTGVARMVLGSIATKILAESTLPVLVAR